MAMKADQMLREKEIQGTGFSLYGKIMIASILTIITFFIAQSLYELFMLTMINLVTIIVLIVLLKTLKKNKFVSALGIICVLLDLAIVSALPFVWYHSVGGESVPRTYLIKTSTHFIIAGTLVMNAFTIQPMYPLLYSFGVVINQALLLWYAQADPRFQSTESFKEAWLGNAAHVNNYIVTMGVIGVLGFALAYLTFRIRKTLFLVVKSELKTDQLSRYFSPHVIQEIESAEEGFFSPGGKKQDVAVLFCDIEGFTQISETLGPEATLSLLSEYHSFMLEAIFKYRGTLDKFIGDGMLVTFGTPQPSEEDPLSAVLAGIEMKHKLAEWNRTRIASGLKPISIRIGIHFGPAIVGNVGVAKRLEYTVIGDTVNAASRIESLGKELKKSFLVSKDLLDRIPNPSSIPAKLKSLGGFSLRGKTKTTEIFSIEVE